MWKILILSVVLIGIAIAAIAIKLFVKKGGEFKKSCSTIDPATGQRMGCTCGEGDGGEHCDHQN